MEKHWCWPKNVPGNEMNIHMGPADVGTVESLSGELDSIKCDLFMMKDVAFTMKLMSTVVA